MSERPVSLLVLVSGEGTNLQALLEAEKRGALAGGRIVAVAADRPCYGLRRAESAGLPGYLTAHSEDILDAARREGAEGLVLAGFLPIIRGKVLEVYSGRILNLHPSLLPKFGGKGMYGLGVHRAVLEARETESGCTVHFVDSGLDCGPILLQRRVPVLPDDNPQTLADRIRREEHIAIVEGTALLCRRLHADRTFAGGYTDYSLDSYCWASRDSMKQTREEAMKRSAISSFTL